MKTSSHSLLLDKTYKEIKVNIMILYDIKRRYCMTFECCHFFSILKLLLY